MNGIWQPDGAMSESGPPQQLQGDATRQAPDLHKGVSYQLWLSVQAWVALKDDELLYLEGAEDFDVVSNDKAIIVQAKATEANITLRSEMIAAALNNYWLVRCNHPDKKIRFRLITTSKVGIEQGQPFGENRKGLDLWQITGQARSLENIDQIRTFLTTDASIAAKLDPVLLEFLRRSTLDEIASALIWPIVWETNSGDSAVLKESVNIFLRAHGEQFGVPPSEAAKSVDSLYRIVAEAAANKGKRCLSKDDFRKYFEQFQFEMVPRNQLVTLRMQAAQFQQKVAISDPQHVGGLQFLPLSLVETGVPNVSPAVIKRQKVVQSITTRLQTKSVIIIGGSSGMGKSTLAKLTAVTMSGEWLWVDFQGLPVQQMAAVLRSFGERLLQAPRGTNVTLDNLDFTDNELEGVGDRLAAMVAAIAARDGKVIVTTQHILSIRLLQKFKATTDDLLRIKSFAEDEVEEFCLALGCSDPERRKLWSKIVFFQTFGHPQLVHARLLALSEVDWPAPSANDFIDQPHVILRELDLEREILNQAPTTDKDLLYRLSLLTTPFRRDQAIAIARIKSEDKFPGDTFDRLVGPWIEPAGGGYFRLSPLLSKSAVQNWPAGEIKELHNSIAQALLGSGRKTLIEASEILFHAILGENEKAIGMVLYFLLTAPIEAYRTIADVLFWLPLFGSTSGKRAYAKNPHLNLSIRIIQFRILAERDQKDLDSHLNTVDAEFCDFPPEDYASGRVMWLTKVLTHVDAPIAPKVLVSYWAELHDLLPQVPEYNELQKAFEAAELGDFRKLDFLGHTLMLAMTRNFDLGSLVELFTAVESLKPAKRDLIVSYYKNLCFPIRIAIDRSCYGRESNVDSVAALTVEQLGKLLPFADKWSFPELRVFVIRLMAGIEDEWRHNPGRALSLLSETLEGSSQDFLIQDQKAFVLYRQKKYSDAADIWEKIIPGWPVPPMSLDLLPVLACQRAGTASGLAGRLSQASSFFERGSSIATVVNARLFALTFKADRAFLFWKRGDREKALSEYAIVLEELESMKAEDEDDFQLHRAAKCIEQVGKWFRADTGLDTSVEEFEPPIGFCSQPEANEKIRDHPRAPLDFLWYFLADVENALDVRAGVFERATLRIKSSKIAAFRGVMSSLALAVAFRRAELNEAVEYCLSSIESVAISMALVKAGRSPQMVDVPTDYEPRDPKGQLEEILVSALVVLANAGKPLDSCLASWSKSVQLWQNPDLSKLVDTVQEILNLEFHDVGRRFGSESATRLEQLICAVRMATEEQRSMEAMFFGQSVIVYALSGAETKKLSAEAIATLVRRTWEKRCAFPADFLSPRLTIPMIKAACKSETAGFTLAARILLEAKLAVPPSILPLQVLQQLQKISLASA